MELLRRNSLRFVPTHAHILASAASHHLYLHRVPLVVVVDSVFISSSVSTADAD